METIAAWGLDVVFGIPGDESTGIIKALRKRQDRIRFAAFARACGGSGFTIEDPGECAATLDLAFNTPGPVLIEAVVDPNEPPMPPKVSALQAAHLAEALAKGTPDGHKIIETVLSDRVRELV
jgi:pyruvate dehydrogenase (quinone)